MQFAGLAVEPELVLQGADTFESGIEYGRRLLRDGSRRPTAIFADTDDAAAGVLIAAHEKAIPVPEALSVIGFGDRVVERRQGGQWSIAIIDRRNHHAQLDGHADASRMIDGPHC